MLVTTKEVNEVKRHSESQQRILDIQTELLKHNKEIGGNLLAAGRRLLGDETRLLRCRVFEEEQEQQDDEETCAVMLSDLLLLCRRDKKRRLLLLHRVALSADWKVQELPCGLDVPNGFALVHKQRGAVELTFHDNEPAGKTWAEVIVLCCVLVFS